MLAGAAEDKRYTFVEWIAESGQAELDARRRRSQETIR
jgi:hypothetical protein